nr:MAG TPA: hypothetical protein [Caudoviricetes sp.]
MRLPLRLGEAFYVVLNPSCILKIKRRNNLI